MSVLAVAEARRNAIPWEVLRNTAVLDKKAVLLLKDRKEGSVPRPASEHLMLGQFRCAFSFEHQPVGLIRHLSVSVRQPGRLPQPIAVKMIMEEFGFQTPLERCQFWREEIDPGHEAINVIELVKETCDAKDIGNATTH